MIVALMQPYFFPYIGYFQLMESVDYFIFHDDVQYIKSGWVNRNRVLLNNAAEWWTMPVLKDTYTSPINRRRYQRSAGSDEAHVRRIQSIYSDAPEIGSWSAALKKLITYEDEIVSSYNQHHLKELAKILRLNCSFLASSELEKDNSLRGQSRVIDICRRLGATQYINPIGGIDLYDVDEFARNGIKLRFLRSRASSYKQFDAPHVPFLSIVDVLMFNSRDSISSQLREFDFVDAERCRSQ